jgi:hypothetical protein
MEGDTGCSIEAVADLVGIGRYAEATRESKGPAAASDHMARGEHAVLPRLDNSTG